MLEKWPPTGPLLVYCGVSQLKLRLTKGIEPALRQALTPFRAGFRVKNGVLRGGRPVMVMMMTFHGREESSYGKSLSRLLLLTSVARTTHSRMSSKVRSKQMLSFRLMIVR